MSPQGRGSAPAFLDADTVSAVSGLLYRRTAAEYGSRIPEDEVQSRFRNALLEVHETLTRFGLTVPGFRDGPVSEMANALERFFLERNILFQVRPVKDERGHVLSGFLAQMDPQPKFYDSAKISLPGIETPKDRRLSYRAVVAESVVVLPFEAFNPATGQLEPLLGQVVSVGNTRVAMMFPDAIRRQAAVKGIDPSELLETVVRDEVAEELFQTIVGSVKPGFRVHGERFGLGARTFKLGQVAEAFSFAASFVTDPDLSGTLRVIIGQEFAPYNLAKALALKVVARIGSTAFSTPGFEQLLNDMDSSSARNEAVRTELIREFSGVLREMLELISADRSQPPTLARLGSFRLILPSGRAGSAPSEHLGGFQLSIPPAFKMSKPWMPNGRQENNSLAKSAGRTALRNNLTLRTAYPREIETIASLAEPLTHRSAE